MKIVRRPRRFALSVAAVALALTASGCAYFNDTQTHDFYQAADGTNANETGLGVRNAVLVVDDTGNGTLYATAVNNTDQDGTVELSGAYEGATVFSTSVEVPAGGTVALGGEGDQSVTATAVEAPAGSIMQLTVTASGQETTTVSLPVLDESLAYYRTAEPGGESTTPAVAPTESATAAADETSSSQG